MKQAGLGTAVALMVIAGASGSVMDLRPWAALGLAINVVTGVMSFVGAPDL